MVGPLSNFIVHSSNGLIWSKIKEKKIMSAKIWGLVQLNSYLWLNNLEYPILLLICYHDGPWTAVQEFTGILQTNWSGFYNLRL